MNNMGLAIYTLSLCLFFASAVIFLLDLNTGERNLFTVAKTLFIAGFASLTILIIARGIIYRYLPLYSFHETLLILGWTAACTLLLLERSYKFRSIYHFTTPFVFILLFFAFFFSPERFELTADMQSAWLYSHILSVMIAYGTFAVAFITSIMYLLVDHNLKKKRLSSFIVNLPSLDSLDLYNYKLVTVGFFLLTISIFLGAVWAQNVWGQLWRWEPKEIWSAITWLFYAIYLHTRVMTGWQGRKVAMLNSLGFATVLFNYIVVRFFFAAGMHTF